ncbi:DENN domain-containing protein 1C isoform X2 [Grammomys surdaster]|uniref:DENN domain-containing protein 1C isoform X2 n=1 Tax=Grammomys surdaster TaxID=491861 RepID=UPI00109F4A40|nr:DENN domain-containing protein 1C isoform X2 [Grammomys surdaster]
MGSTETRHPPAVFDWFFEAGRPNSLEEDPPILWQFPPDFQEQEAMQMVPRFCFPFDIESHFPWFEVFYKILNTVGDLLAQNQVSEAEELLQNLQQHPPFGSRFSGGPEMDGNITIWSESGIVPPVLGNSKLLSCFVAPDAADLPSIPENRNLTELVVAVTDENIVGLFAALLAERRVLLTASKLSTLTACVHASCALLYPMRWEHVLIPTLPPHLLDYCCAPMPYLIGVHGSLAERVREKALEDVVVLNADSNTLETPFDDVQALPPDVVSLLRLQLRKVALSPGEGVSRLFLKAQALLFGGYRDALVCIPGQPVTFSEEAFLAQKPGAPLQTFHKKAVHLQLFKQFIESRLEKLNAGEGFSDQFEQEIVACCGASSGTLRSYQLWVDSLKKGSDALLHSMKAKTRPAVRNLYRSARSGLKGMQSLLMMKDGDSGLKRGGSLRASSLTSRSDCLQQRLPISHHFGQNRPLRPSKRLKMERGPSEPLQERIPTLSPGDTQNPWAEDTLDGSFLGPGEELDLLSEILDSLSVETKSGGQLRASQSLDCCQQEASESCSSLPNIPIGSPRQLEEDKRPQDPQPWSLPGDLSLLQDTSFSEVVSYSKNSCSQSPSALSFLSTSSATSAEPSSQGDLRPSVREPDPRPSQSPCSRLLTAPTQPSPPKSPQLLASTESNPDAIQKLQLIPSPSCSPTSAENPRNQPPQILLGQDPIQPLKELGTPTSYISHVSKQQGPQDRQPRVADLKKCFEN